MRGKSQKSLALIDAAKRILAEIQPATVRAVCYRLMPTLIDSMSKSNTNMVSRHLVFAREQGIIPWEWIVDETRAPETVPTWASPLEIFEAAARQYRFDFWSMQPNRIEVWSEKGTVRGTLQPVLDQYAVTFLRHGGHSGATTVHDRAVNSSASKKPMTVIYVGDYDPSGMHMSVADLPRRVKLYGGEVSIVRVAILKRDLKPLADHSFPADDKRADTRYRWFVEKYGKRCVELDALNPTELRGRVEAEIRKRLDLDAWDHAMKIETVQRESIAEVLAAMPSKLRRAHK
jgi:hypothetical protein